MASTLEIPTGMSATPQINIDRSMNQGTKIFVDRKNKGSFSQTDLILNNMTEFNIHLFEYLSNMGIPLKPLNYGSDELPQFNYEEIANLGYSEYKSFTNYIVDTLSEDQIKLIKSTKDTSKPNGTAYDLFVKQCMPYIYIEFNKGNWFNVNILKNGKYKNERGTGERLIFFADGLVTKYQIPNQEERNNKTVGSQNLKLKDIMPNITCDVNQPSQRGKKTVLALQFLNDLYKLTFALFKDDIVAPLQQNSGASASKTKKQQQIDHLNDSDQILFKDKSYTKTNPETQEKSVVEFTVFDLKLLGKPDNNLQSIITNTNESDTIEPMVVDGHNINLDNIDVAFPRGVLISTWINMESVTYVPSTKHLYWNFKCYQIDVDRRYITLFSTLGSLDIRSLCKNEETPQIFDINKSPESKAEVFPDNEEDDDEDEDGN
jgi:hypothetical protein